MELFEYRYCCFIFLLVFFACFRQPPQLTHAEKEQLKEAMLQVMARGTRDVAQEAQFIKIKVLMLILPYRYECPALLHCLFCFILKIGCA